MLDAGVRLYGMLAGGLLRGLTVRTVAEEAGYHRQTFYRYWSTQAEYVADLIEHLLAPDPAPVANGGAAVAGPRHEGPQDLSGMARAMARHDFAQVIDDERMAMRIGLLLMDALAAPPWADLCQAYYEDSLATLTAVYDEVLEGLDLAPCPPTTTRDLARLGQAQLLGLVLQAKMAKDDPPGPELLGLAAETLLRGLTRPRAA